MTTDSANDAAPKSAPSLLSPPTWRDFHNVVRAMLARRWIRFGIVGGIATLCYAVLGLLFVNVWGMPALVGNALSYVLSFVVSYLGQSLWTFEMGRIGDGTGNTADAKCNGDATPAQGNAVPRASHKTMLPRFALTQGIGLACNSVIVWVLMRFGLPYEAAMPVAIVTVPILVYMLCKYWVFRK